MPCIYSLKDTPPKYFNPLAYLATAHFSNLNLKSSYFFKKI